MKPQTIAKIDRIVGRPICLVLTLLRRLGNLALFFRSKRTPSPVKKILFIKMIEQGATVLAYRAVARAVERVGRENVYFWVFEENRPILDLLGVIPPENVITVRTKGAVRQILSLIRTLFKVRKLRVDATVDMEFFSRASAILAFLSRARVRIGLHRFTSEGPYRGDLLTHRLQYNPYLHAAMQYWLMVEAAWSDPGQTPMMKILPPRFDGAPPLLKPTPVQVQEVHDILNRLAKQNFQGRLVLLNPNASDLLPLRKWPTDRFIELGKRLLKEPDVWVAITGAPSESHAAQAVADAIGTARCMNLAGQTTLAQLMVLYTIADVLVTNDSGPGHFSSMTTLPTVVLFGPETPLLYGPLGPNTHVIWQNLACSPCVNVLNHRFSPCNDNVCMQRITVGEVFAKVMELLRSNSKSEDDRVDGSPGYAIPLAAGDSSGPLPLSETLEERVRESFNTTDNQH